MSVLLRASEIAKLPVVTFAGDDVAQIKDLVYAAGGGEVGGFTLAGRGLFAGPLKTGLPWAAVAGLGPDAVMIADGDALAPLQDVVEPASSSSSTASKGDVLGSQVLTDAGTALGTVVDVIVEVTAPASQGGQADVVGYEIQPAERRSKKLLIPLPDTLAASGEHLIVPASATDFVRDDLAGFGAAVTDFRAQLSRTSLMRFSEAKGHKVVSTSTADTIGNVSELVVDPHARAVIAVQLRKSGQVLRWPDLTAFGADAVTVDGEARLTDPDEQVTALTGKDHLLVGKRLLTTGGVQLGKVTDVEFDAASGAVTSVEHDGGAVPGERLVGVGSWAVVVRPE